MSKLEALKSQLAEIRGEQPMVQDEGDQLRNLKITRKGNKLTLTVDLSDPFLVTFTPKKGRNAGVKQAVIKHADNTTFGRGMRIEGLNVKLSITEPQS